MVDKLYALVEKWREDARRVRPLESAPVSSAKRQDALRWMLWTNCANELAAALTAQGETAPWDARTNPAGGQGETAPAPVDEQWCCPRCGLLGMKAVDAASPVPAPADDRLCGCGYRESLHKVGDDDGVYCQLAKARAALLASPVPAAEGLRNFFSYEPDKREALQRHIAAIDGRRPQDGHNDRGFSTCQHPACVRANAPVAAEGLDVETLARETAQDIESAFEADFTDSQMDELRSIILAALRAVADAEARR